MPLPNILPKQLASLGYRLLVVDGVTAVIPPLCVVPAGPFLMGSRTEDDPHARPEELPQHTVDLPAFEIARFPVTVFEYRYAIAAGIVPRPYQWAYLGRRSAYPAVNVSWYAARDYANWLSGLTQQTWRLPTEAEWEKAARGTDGRIYPWGSDPWDPWNNARDTRLANVAGTSDVAAGYIGGHPGGASPYGAEDMIGSVWEWCSSLRFPYPYDPADGREDLTVAADIPDYEANPYHARVVRGSSFYEGPTWARCAMRGLHVPPWNLDGDIGFRLVRG